jgi:acid phosphatase (class A)
MKRNLGIAAICAAVLLAGLAYWWSRETPNYLPADVSAFVAQVTPPPAPDSSEARAELAQLLAIQTARTPAVRDAARADRKKDIWQFYGALGLDRSADDAGFH